MNVLLMQLDGKIPNIALMRIAAHHEASGDTVDFRWVNRIEQARRGMFDDYDRIYASAIFEKTRPIAREVLAYFPGAIVGGSGWDEAATLEKIGIAEKRQDYSIYGDEWRQSIGFTQRGCRFRCSFCKVPAMEGRPREEASIEDIWRGDPWPRELILLDNDFFGQTAWQKRIEEIRGGKFKVSFNQGINARMLTDETAAALASVDYRNANMKERRIYTAWDNRRDEARLLRGLASLTKHGIKPDHIMVYILIGYDHQIRSAAPSLTEDDFHRHARLREFGCRPYPMPYVRSRELVGFQRWVVGAYDKRFSWSDWKAAGYRPERLGNAAS